MNKLLLRRFPLAERSRILVEAAKGASLAWLADLAERCVEHKKRQYTDDDKLVDNDTADAVLTHAVGCLEAGAEDGSLLAREDVCRLLHRWCRLAADGETAVQGLVKRNLDDDQFIVRLAAATISNSSVHSSGDLVARPERSVRVEAIARFVDMAEFTRRLEEVSTKIGLDDKSTKILSDFRNLPRETEAAA